MNRYDRLDVEQRIDRLVTDLDEICAIAANPVTARYVAEESIGIAQIMLRSQLLLSAIANTKKEK